MLAEHRSLRFALHSCGAKARRPITAVAATFQLPSRSGGIHTSKQDIGDTVPAWLVSK